MPVARYGDEWHVGILGVAAVMLAFPRMLPIRGRSPVVCCGVLHVHKYFIIRHTLETSFDNKKSLSLLKKREALSEKCKDRLACQLKPPVARIRPE